MICPVLSGKDALSKFVALGVSAFSPSPDRSSAYSLIEGEILDLEESILQIGDLLRQWKTHHNTLSITARLPDELLHHVFGFLNMASPQWITATHVCSRWRNAALGCPCLWRRPFFHNLDFGNEMKRRAKATPLIIEVNKEMFGLPIDQYHDIFSNIKQAEELILYDNNGTYALLHEGSRRLRLTEFPGLKLPAPLLKRVTLTSTPFGEDYLLPSDFSVENAPNLQYLKLKNWNLPWTMPLESFVGLTELHISFDGSLGARNHRFPLFCVASMLIRFQSLKSLTIDDIFHDISPADSQWFSQNRDLIKFPALQKLDFRSKLEVRELFFSRFDWTNPTFVWIKGCWHGSEVPEPELASARTFLRTLGHRLPYPIRYLSLWEGDTEDYINLSISHRSANIDLPNPETIRMELPPLPDLASDLMQFFPLQDLERFNYLQSKAYGPLRADIWASLGRSTKLGWIQVAYNQPGLLKLLASKVTVQDEHSSSEPPSRLGPDDSNSERSWLFPALKVLYIDRWVFWKPDPEENFGIVGPSWIVPDDNIEYDELRSVLASRKENGCELEHISFWHCKGISRVDLVDLHDVCSKAAFWKDEEPE